MSKECCMCWKKDANSYFRFLKSDLTKCLMHLKYIEQYPCLETSVETGNQLTDFYNSCVWLCPSCADQCKKIVSADSQIQMNTNLLKNITETYTSSILFDRNQNRPNESSIMEDVKVDFDADATIKNEVNHISFATIKQEQINDTSELKLFSSSLNRDSTVRHQIKQHEGMEPLKGREQTVFSHPESRIPSVFENNPFHLKSSERESEIASNGLPIGCPKVSQIPCLSGTGFNLDFSNFTQPTKSEVSLVSKSRRPKKKNKKRYECTSCYISFPKLKRFRIHNFEIHGFDNIYARKVKCSVCSKYVKNLDDHMKIHQGILDYRCPVCHKKFCRPLDLEQHQKGSRKCCRSSVKI